MGVQESRLFPMRTRKTGPKEEGSKMRQKKLSWMLGLFLTVILLGLIIKLF